MNLNWEPTTSTDGKISFYRIGLDWIGLVCRADRMEELFTHYNSENVMDFGAWNLVILFFSHLISIFPSSIYHYCSFKFVVFLIFGAYFFFKWIEWFTRFLISLHDTFFFFKSVAKYLHSNSDTIKFLIRDINWSTYSFFWEKTTTIYCYLIRFKINIQNYYLMKKKRNII